MGLSDDRELKIRPAAKVLGYPAENGGVTEVWAGLAPEVTAEGTVENRGECDTYLPAHLLLIGKGKGG